MHFDGNVGHLRTGPRKTLKSIKRVSYRWRRPESVRGDECDVRSFEKCLTGLRGRDGEITRFS